MRPAVSPEPSQDQTLQAARAGDRDAFETLYRAHVGRIYALCLRLVADPEQAETLTQDAFVQAWRKLPQFRGDSAFGTWLYRLTTNLVLDWQRARTRRRRWEQPLDPIEQEAALQATAPPARVVDRLELEQAIGELPDGARAVFVLQEVEGYSVKEIAGMLEIAEGTVKAQNFRARRLLRERLR